MIHLAARDDALHHRASIWYGEEVLVGSVRVPAEETEVEQQRDVRIRHPVVGLPAPAHSVDTPQGLSSFCSIHGRCMLCMEEAVVVYMSDGSPGVCAQLPHQVSMADVDVRAPRQHPLCIPLQYLHRSCNSSLLLPPGPRWSNQKTFVHASAYHAQKSEAECLTQFC